MKYSEIITVLDIGNTKINCSIARLLKNGKIEILGNGCCSCNGLNLGVITELESVQKSISKAVEMAESQAKYRVKAVYVSVSGAGMKSYINKVCLSIGGRIVTENDINKALYKLSTNDKNFVILHKVPITYTLDSLPGIKNPVGMVADKIEIDTTVMSIPKAQLRNILLCLSRCHLEIEDIVAAPYALSFAINKTELPKEVLLIDFGGGVTTISFLYNGIFCGAEIVPYGGGHITNEISNKLDVSYSDAERLKVLYGTALPVIDNDNTPILAPLIDGSNYIGMQQVSKATINQIIIDKIKEILSLTMNKIEKSIFGPSFANSVIIAGGVSQTVGITDIIAASFNKKVSFISVKSLVAFSENEITMSDAVSLGMIMYTDMLMNKNESLPETKMISKEISNKNNSWLSKTLIWLKDNL